MYDSLRNESGLLCERELISMDYLNKVLLGDCEEVLKGIPDNSVDLIFTSPPYADQRRRTYGGIRPDDYVDWFMPKADQFYRVLKPKGTFVLNIKERVVNGERHTYVMELMLSMRRRGWLWTEEFIWHKKNSYPGKWPNRFRDNWERLIQFNKEKKFHMYQEAVMVPVGEWAKHRLANLSETDRIRDESKVGSGFGKNISNWLGRDMVYPNNVLHISTECGNRNHSAAFPVGIPSWFIKLFTEAEDVVLDPFVGSGSTLVASVELGRRYIGIDVNPDYVALSQSRTHAEPMRLPGIAEEKQNGYALSNTEPVVHHAATGH